MNERIKGPNLAALALVSLGLTVAGLATIAISTGGGSVVSPFSSGSIVADFYRDNAHAVALQSMLLVGSAVPLGIFAATAATRQRALGVRVPGPSIGFFGGVAASIFLTASAMFTWVLSRPEVVADHGIVRTLAFLAFISGGVGFVVPLGLLVAGLAVPTIILRLMPRWFGWTGLVLALLSEASFLSMVIDPLQFLIPVGRFGGLLWLIAAGFLLPKRAHVKP